MVHPEETDRRSEIEPSSEQLPEGYLDIYKLAVEMADRVSARRAIASSFFLTALSTLVVLLGATSTKPWAFAVPGAALAAVWWLLLRSYRLLNKAKFEVIQKLEERLPAAPYTDEWPVVKEEEPRGLRDRYAELSLLEQVVPAVFGIVFVVVAISSLT